MRGCVAARPGAERVRLVDDQQRARPAGCLPKSILKAGLGVDDPDVRQCRLGQDARDIAHSKLTLERLDVVPLDHPRRFFERHRRPDVPFAGDHRRTVESGERLVDGPVVTPVEDEDLRPARELPREPDRETICVGRSERELPARQPETAGELLSDPERVLTWEHERDASRCLLRHRLHGRRRGVPGHRRRVAKAEVHVVVAVHVAKASAVRLHGEHREPSRPGDHPRHRHSREQRTFGPRRELARTWVLTFEALELAREKIVQRHHASQSTSNAYVRSVRSGMMIPLW